MQYIKGNFSFRLKSKMDVWEGGFNEHRIRDAADYQGHVSYMDDNPVKRALADTPAAYPYSSASGGHEVDAAPNHVAPSQG